MVIRKVQEAEVDEMWSFVGHKERPRWLWGALDHQTGRIVASVFGRRADRAFLALSYSPRSGFVVFIRTAGARITDTWIHTSMWSARA